MGASPPHTPIFGIFFIELRKSYGNYRGKTLNLDNYNGDSQRPSRVGFDRAKEYRIIQSAYNIFGSIIEPIPVTAGNHNT